MHLWKEKLKMDEKQQCCGLIEIQVNLGHSKVHMYNLAMILKEKIHIKMYYFILTHMVSHYR
jgi:ribonucleotide reductase beta subunit family protein with ferritin-like domain